MGNLGNKEVNRHGDVAKCGAVAASRAPARVLFIEDNLGLSSGMRVLLEHLGYEVHLAHEGHEGLETARRVRPDVVICDLGLPEMNGYQVAERLRRTPETSGIALIAVTGHSHTPCAALAREAGFDCFLAKPVCIEDLREALEGAVGRGPARQRSTACLSGFFSH